MDTLDFISNTYTSILVTQYPTLTAEQIDDIVVIYAETMKTARRQDIREWWAFYITDIAVAAYQTVGHIPPHAMRADGKALLCLYAEYLMAPNSPLSPPTDMVKRFGMYAANIMYLADMFLQELKKKWRYKLVSLIFPNSTMLYERALGIAISFTTMQNYQDHLERKAKSIHDTFHIDEMYAHRLVDFLAAQRYRYLGMSLEDTANKPITEDDVMAIFEETILASQSAYVKLPTT